MQQNLFKSFWDKWSARWYASEIKINEKLTPIAELCSIKPEYDHVLYQHYSLIKQIVKDSYFRNTEKKLSRYKRAAVIAYAINGSSPLEYKDSSIEHDLDFLYLKQRLAFYVALGSIIQDYPEDDISKLKKPYFDFDSLGKKDIVDGEDDFLLSVYKDMFYADVYENYNVLTMANVFGLLTERASELGQLTPIVTTDE